MVRTTMAVAATLILASTPVPGSASVVTYDYVTDRMYCTIDEGSADRDWCYYGDTVAPMRGTLSIDTSALPGGSIFGVTISLEWSVSLLEPYPRGFLGYEVSTLSGDYSGELDFEFGQAESFWAEIGITMSGYLSWFSGANSVHVGEFQISFTEDGAVDWWRGQDMAGGPSTDPYTGTGGDGFGYYASTGPGRWVAPVPLPASGLLLLAGVGAMVAGRRRRALRGKCSA